jgi:hypothetical protein
MSAGATWVTAATLKALAAAGLKAGAKFSALDLAAMHGMGDLTAAQRVHATTRLCGLKFLAPRMELRPDAAGAEQSTRIYTVTADGAAAIEAARQGQVRKSGPKTTRKGNPVDPAAFTTRLWNLVRIRKVLTPRQAAETLCDAGDEAFERRWATARKCLRRWANAGALQESAKRIGAAGTSNGDKRYVLVKDSPTPPTWHQPKHAAVDPVADTAGEAA